MNESLLTRPNLLTEEVRARISLQWFILLHCYALFSQYDRAGYLAIIQPTALQRFLAPGSELSTSLLSTEDGDTPGVTASNNSNKQQQQTGEEEEEER